MENTAGDQRFSDWSLDVVIADALNPQLGTSIIDASQRGPALVLAIKQALDEGSMVGMMADRAREGERTATVDFLGGKAQLPVAPWIMAGVLGVPRSEEHTSELQSLMRISYAVFCLKKKKTPKNKHINQKHIVT